MPDSRQIITISGHQLRLTIWSLTSNESSYINYPKYSKKGISFSKNGNFLALIERRQCIDYIGIYETKNWKIVSHFPAEIEDAEDLLWASDDSAIIVWNNPFKYKLIVYSISSSQLSLINPQTNGLGIKKVEISPNQIYIGIGSYDGKVYL